MAGKQKVDFDEFVDRYDALLEEQLSGFDAENDYFAEYKIKVVRDLVRGAPRAILDYGCGTGRSLPHLAKLFPGAQLSGCDVSAQSVAFARKGNPTVDFFPLAELSERRGRFDLVFVAGVFHHIAPEERNQAMSSLAACLAPGAELAIFEHNPFNPITRRIVRDCPYDADAVLLRPSELRLLLKRHRLSVRRVGYTLFFPRFLKAFRPFEKHMTWLPLGGQYFVHACRDRAI